MAATPANSSSEISSNVCHFGMIGAATIARKNWQAIRLAPTARLSAVAARSGDRAQAFIDELTAVCPHDSEPAAVEGYDNLLARDDVDAVYIAVPTALREEWVLKAAAAGKHVLTEKPVGVDAAAVRRMLDACRDGGVQFMDGVMFMHSDRLSAMRTVLDDGETVGAIRRIATHFSFNGGDDFAAQNIRAGRSLEPLGALGDLGWYCLRFILWAMKWQSPRSVSARIHAWTGGDAEHGTPAEMSGELLFEGDVSASFFCSFRTHNQQWAHICGADGSVHVRDFVLPLYGSRSSFVAERHEFTVDGCDFDMTPGDQVHHVPEYSNSHVTAQECRLFETFSRLAISGTPDEFWGRIALQTQEVADACLASATAGGQPISPS
jgi:predicted dehydrogenase